MPTATSSPPAGTEAPPAPCYEPFDPDYAREVITQHFGPALYHYFRPRLLGAHKIPRQGPVILAPNHSGSAFPYDAIVLDSLLWARDGFRPEAKFRSVFEKELAVNWWMRPFGIDDFWRRGGGVDMTFDNYDRLLELGERVIHYPEGVPGIGKGFARRYQLQRFSSSFVHLAAKHGAPVLPVHVVNAEWVVPFSFMIRWVDRLVQRLLGVPFLPLPAAPLALLFPWMWYLSLPARMVFVVGDPIDVRQRLAERGAADPTAADRRLARQVADEVQREVQQGLARWVEKVGRWPYQGRLLRRHLRQARRRRRLAAMLPSGWPIALVRHHRDRLRAPARNRLHRWLRDWDLIGFYLPLGWLLLAATRRWRRPPCGYRGLSRRERRRREGAFHWHLHERPLAPRHTRFPHRRG